MNIYQIVIITAIRTASDYYRAPGHMLKVFPPLSHWIFTTVLASYVWKAASKVGPSGVGFLVFTPSRNLLECGPDLMAHFQCPEDCKGDAVCDIGLQKADSILPAMPSLALTSSLWRKWLPWFELACGEYHVRRTWGKPPINASGKLRLAFQKPMRNWILMAPIWVSQVQSWEGYDLCWHLNYNLMRNFETWDPLKSCSNPWPIETAKIVNICFQLLNLGAICYIAIDN